MVSCLVKCLPKVWRDVDAKKETAPARPRMGMVEVRLIAPPVLPVAVAKT